MTEEEAYATALHEVQIGAMSPGILAKAMAFSDGDENKAKANYLRFRAEQLVRDHRLESVSKHATQVSETLLSPAGRMTRGPYILTLAGSLVVSWILTMSVAQSVPWYESRDGYLLLISIGWLVIVLVASIKRCRDAGLSPWWALLILVTLPLLVGVVGIAVLAYKPSANKGDGGS